MRHFLLMLGLTACGLSHGTNVIDAGMGIDVPTDSEASDAGVVCSLPLSLNLAGEDGIEAAALYIDASSFECSLLCSQGACSEVGATRQHALQFEFLSARRLTRVSTEFGGIGYIAGSSGGDFVGDGLVQGVPLNQLTAVTLRRPSVEHHIEVEFVLRDEGAQRSVTVVEIREIVE